MSAVPCELWVHVMRFVPDADSGKKRGRNECPRAPVWCGAALLRVCWATHLAARAALTEQPAGRAFLHNRMLNAHSPFPAWLTATDGFADVLRAMHRWAAFSVCRSAALRGDPREWAVIARVVPMVQWVMHAPKMSVETLVAAVDAAGKQKTPRTPPAVSRAIADATEDKALARVDVLLRLVPPPARAYVNCLRAAQPVSRAPARVSFELVTDYIAASDDVAACVAIMGKKFAHESHRAAWHAQLWSRCCMRRAVKCTEAVVVHGAAPLNGLENVVRWCSLLTAQAWALGCRGRTDHILCGAMQNPDPNVLLFVWSACPDPVALYSCFRLATFYANELPPTNVSAVLGLVGALPLSQRAAVQFIFDPDFDPAHLNWVADAIIGNPLSDPMTSRIVAKLRASERLAELLTLAIPPHTPKYDTVLRIMCTTPYCGVWAALINHHDWSVANKRHN